MANASSLVASAKYPITVEFLPAALEPTPIAVELLPPAVDPLPIATVPPSVEIS